MRALALVAAVCAAVCVSMGCGGPEPVKIGFIAPLSGRFASLGGEARNGALIALDKANAAGGARGRPFELVMRDTAHEPEKARQAMRELIAAGVVAVIGPFTSDMAEVAVPLADEARIPLVSPIATSTRLAGLDDYFLRTVSTNQQYGAACAKFFAETEKSRRVALILDDSNRSYTEDWSKFFEAAFRGAGGEIVGREHFYADSRASLVPEVERLLATSPDLIIAVTSGIDAARIAHLVRQRNLTVKLGSAEWAAGEQLIEVGGRAVEGMFVPQMFDRDSASPAYIAFRARYRDRFDAEPGFTAVITYDAMTFAASTLAAGGGNVRQHMLERRVFDGLQQRIELNQYGDTSRNLFMTVVRAAQYRKLTELGVSSGAAQ